MEDSVLAGRLDGLILGQSAPVHNPPKGGLADALSKAGGRKPEDDGPHHQERQILRPEIREPSAFEEDAAHNFEIMAKRVEEREPLNTKR